MSERARFGLIPTLAIHECRNTDEIAILAVIGCFMGDDGWNEAAPAEVAALCHLEADHTVRCIADLEARGLLGALTIDMVRRCEGPDEVALLTAIAFHAGEKGWCWPSRETLAELCKRSPAWVSQAVTKLQERGLLNVIRRKHGWKLQMILDEPNPEVSPLTLETVQMSAGSPICQPADIELIQGNFLKKRSSNEERTGAREARAVSKSLMEEDWHPDLPDLMHVADKLGLELHSQALADVVDEFRNYWLGVGKPMAKWGAVFRNRAQTLKDRKFNGPATHGYQQRPSRQPTIVEQALDIARELKAKRGLQ
jgi:hypothetical protein